MTGRIFSPGKLLLTAEYTVLDGALALAVPTKWGQEFFFEEIEDGEAIVCWEALHQDKLWLQATINYAAWEVAQTNLPEPAQFILKVLQNVAQLSSLKFKSTTSYRLKTNLQFPPDYGLGSSSTLINNLAEWAAIDAFTLNEMSLGGSGYDIAVAKEKSAIVFQNTAGRKISEPVNFSPPFLDELIFIHLNQKQNSREGIELYRSKNVSADVIDWFSEFTQKVILCEDVEQFSGLMASHEQKLSNYLLIKTAKEKHLPGCPVFVKSLGAWGGDFVMSRKFPNYESYFSELGFTHIYTWKELIL
ncbi:hypothetical protein FIC_02308 [Flavobacteriaceae bacterium 3519-10]|nr:hypothetical protein FIC_02308 [Flavobacteriaceae bacterium 3519-10]